jgi:hypothetical protein
MSIQEMRRIFFGLPALREAMQSIMPDIAPGLVPRGSQVKGLVVFADPLMVRIRVMPPGASEFSDAKVSAAQIGALIIRRCKSLGIPLPRQGTKGLEGDPAGIALIITLSHEAKGHSQMSVHRISA